MADLPRISIDGSIATNLEGGAYFVTKALQNLSHIPCILDD